MGDSGCDFGKNIILGVISGKDVITLGCDFEIPLKLYIIYLKISTCLFIFIFFPTNNFFFFEKIERYLGSA